MNTRTKFIGAAMLALGILSPPLVQGKSQGIHDRICRILSMNSPGGVLSLPGHAECQAKQGTRVIDELTQEFLDSITHDKTKRVVGQKLPNGGLSVTVVNISTGETVRWLYVIKQKDDPIRLLLSSDFLPSSHKKNQSDDVLFLPNADEGGEVHEMSIED